MAVSCGRSAVGSELLVGGGVSCYAAAVRDFRQLQVWQKAHRFVLDVYRESRGFPAQERFGLTSQLRRSASSVASNIAEGCGREGERELARFLSIASGSACEAEYQLLLAKDLGYLPAPAHSELDAQVNEVKKMLNGFMHALG
jgi:four helix bundle protein